MKTSKVRMFVIVKVKDRNRRKGKTVVSVIIEDRRIEGKLA